jgi:uncharacterized protein
MDFSIAIAHSLQISPKQVAATIQLLDEGNTLPFIARYRKEVTGTLDEEQIRAIQTTLEALRILEERRQTVLASIEEQGKLTPELRAQIVKVETKTELEDLYQPYKPKRRTRASIAREKGLDGLASLILSQSASVKSIEEAAQPFLNDQVASVEEAFAGARDIIAETVSDHPDVRRVVRERTFQMGAVGSQKVPDAEDPKGVYSLYYEYAGRIENLRPHQVLAIERGEKEKILRVHMDIPEGAWRSAIAAHFPVRKGTLLGDQMQLAIDDGAERLLIPAIERDIRRTLFESAELHAIGVFAENLRGLLSQPPLAGQVVMGIDPGFRTGCKIAVVDPTGKVLATGTIYPHEPQKAWQASLKTLESLAETHHVTLLSIGNGTASRESEQLAVELIHICPGIRYLITNEAGASVYSASQLARAEMPDLDVSIRGAVSIARRVQDPLAELVKIDPQSIGVGLYQHDVDQKQLEESLTGVVESVVNQVGVDLNTASPALLTYVSGVGAKLAQSIVAFRDEHGPFKNRTALRKVTGLGPKAFEQSAGFLRIRGGDEPLDSSAVHPESYPAAKTLMQMTGADLKMPAEQREKALQATIGKTVQKEIAATLEIGLPTLKDILEQLVRPGRDPRADLPAPILRSDVLKMEDLQPGMALKGTVRNVVDFGAFVDIGVKHDGLLHRTQIPAGVKLRVGDIINLTIGAVEPERGRISLGWLKDS